MNVYHPALGGQAEPGAVVVIPQSFIGDFVVTVSVLRMRIPARFRPHFAILVSNENVAFPSGLAGKLEGDIGEAVHVGFSALADLHKLEVAANDLVIGCVAISVFHYLPIFPNLERAHGLVRVEVALPRLGFHHLVGAVGQSPGICLGDAVHHLDGGTHLAGLV